MIEWAQYAPYMKRAAVFGGVIGAVAALAGLSTWLVPAGNPEASREDTIHNILTDSNPRDLSLDGLAAQQRELRRQLEDLSRTLETVKEQQSRAQLSDEARFRQWTAEERAAYDRKLQALGSRLNQAPPRESGEEPPRREPPAAEPAPSERPWRLDSMTSGNPFEAGSTASWTPDAAAGTAPEAPIIRHIGFKKAEPPNTAPAPDKEDVFLTAGTILSGVLITGLDAPTSQRGRQDPYPVMLRVKREAILPNRYRADVRECFVVAAGYGDLSSERAYLRAESISCVRDDRKAIEANLDAYAVGEDGKLGVRGRLVSKQGRLLANAMLAGFAKGFAQVFGTQPVPVIINDPQNAAPFQQAFSGKAVQSGVVRGVGEALNRLANFYIDMAENIFPVIEVDAGRKTEFILNRGLSLKIKG